jgi:CheY-like chemotaxis protein
VQTDAAPQGLRLLYVEDNEANIEVVQAVMALRSRWLLEIARNGAEAVELSMRRRPDLVVVDMHLPDTTGLDLARRWDADPATAGMPRVALSADATALRARAAADYGFRRYFTKPLDIHAFLAWLDEFELQSAQARRASEA